MPPLLLIAAVLFGAVLTTAITAIIRATLDAEDFDTHADHALNIIDEDER